MIRHTTPHGQIMLLSSTLLIFQNTLLELWLARRSAYDRCTDVLTAGVIRQALLLQIRYIVWMPL